MDDIRFYFKEWRKFRGLTQDQVVDRLVAFEDPTLPQTAASLSRIENGKQPYAQPIVEALAEVYSVEPKDLLGNHPKKEGDVVDMVRLLDVRQRQQALAIIEALKSA